MSPNAPTWLRVMRELLHNARIVLKQDQLAVACLASEMAALPVDPMTVLANGTHTIFRNSEVDPAKACQPTPYGLHLWRCIEEIHREEKKEPPQNLFRPEATKTLLEWESWILEHRPKMLTTSVIPKINKTNTFSKAEARKRSLRPRKTKPLPKIVELDTPGSNPKTFLLTPIYFYQSKLHLHLSLIHI